MKNENEIWIQVFAVCLCLCVLCLCVQTTGPPVEKLDLLFRNKSRRESPWALEEEDDVMDDSVSTTYSTGEQVHVLDGERYTRGAGAAVAPDNIFLLMLLLIVLILFCSQVHDAEL